MIDERDWFASWLSSDPWIVHAFQISTSPLRRMGARIVSRSSRILRTTDSMYPSWFSAMLLYRLWSSSLSLCEPGQMKNLPQRAEMSSTAIQAAAISPTVSESR